MTPRDRVTLAVRDWMHAHPVVVQPKDSVEHARAVCEDRRINQLPVVSGKTLVGIVTDRDLRDAFPSVGEQIRDPERSHAETETTLVEDVMSPQVLTVSDSDTVEHAARVMQEERIGALPVLRDGHLVGIITRHDLLRALVALAQQVSG